MTPPFQFHQGRVPLLISVPHNGSFIPDELASEMTDAGRSSIDTDWFLDRLYNFASDLGVGMIAANYSRYVIDLNRALTDKSLYPGQTTTGLLPTETFDGESLFNRPRPEASRGFGINAIWNPYHEAIQSELKRLRTEHGRVVLFDAHSIASRVPRLFPGQLPDLNFGTNHGTTCDGSLSRALETVAQATTDYSHVFNGRFVGGHITRHYGDPTAGVHAVQLELSQATYLDEDSKQWSADKSSRVQPTLKAIIGAILSWLESDSQ